MKKYSRKSDGKNIYNEAGKVVGVVRGDTLYKSIAPNHYLRQPHAIANSTYVLDEAERAGAVRVEITDRETRTKYIATIEHIRRDGIKLNRGHGSQIALPLSGWIRKNPGQATQAVLAF